MLDIDTSEKYQRILIGTFSEHPKLTSKLAGKIPIKAFSSNYRRKIFLNILNAIKIKLEPTKEIIWDGMLENDDDKSEMSRCIALSDIVNIRFYIDKLREHVSVSELYVMAQQIQDKVTKNGEFTKINSYIVKRLAELDPSSSDEFASNMSTAINELGNQEETFEQYDIGFGKWDEIIPIQPRSIWVIAGNEGTFKTKLMIFLVRKLLSSYDDIAVKWFSMEDPRDKLLRGFISQDTLLTDKEIIKIKDYKRLLPKTIKTFDIEFVNKSSTIKEIGSSFRKFRDERKDKFNILIVDNIMKIKPSEFKQRGMDADEEIIREIDSWNIKTDPNPASVFLLHHFTKEAMDSKNEFKGYEPHIAMMRAGGRFKDTATHVLLVNAMYSYPNIIRAFSKVTSMMDRYYIVQIAKNRNGQKATMRMFAFADYNHFYNID